MRSFARVACTTSAVILATLILNAAGWGKPVESKAALQVAEAWLAANPTPMVSSPNSKVWKAKGVRPFRGYSGDVLAYIVDLKPQGFIVVPADDEIEPILTFGTESNFTGLQGPEEALSDILAGDIPSRLRNKYKQPLEYHEKIAERWSTLRKASLAATPQDAGITTITPVVSPLVTDTWNQGGSAPYTYNYYTPNHYVTGCVATAMGMIIHFQRYPASASCTNTIYVDGYPQTASFDSSFSYDLMPSAISGTSPLANIQEVAKLLYDCGISVNMQYSNGSSGAYTAQVASALVNTFHYSTATWKSGYDPDWATVLKNELSAGYPTEMEIRANNGTAGHAIVCDGWGTESGADRFHLNMGWGGYADNWYAVPGFSAGGYYWDQMPGYVYNVRKPGDTPLPTPTFSPDGGTYSAPQNVVISCAVQDAVIHYTTNGTDPTESDPVVSGPVPVDTGLTLKAKAWKTGMTPSAVKSATYVLQPGTPAFSPDGGTYPVPQNVTISCPTEDAVIHYTTSGNDPTESDPAVNGPVPVTTGLTLKARAWKPGWSGSPTKSATYVFQTGMPVFTPDGGDVNSPLNVTVFSPTPGATIHYTTSGVDPTQSDPVVNGSIYVSRNLTLKAKAWRTGWGASSVKSASYNVVLFSSMKKLGSDSAITMNRAVVTAAPATSRFYIEADDRSCGILVYKSGYKATIGSRVTVVGTLGTSSSGEKWVTATSITSAGGGTIAPIMLSNRAVGGDDWCYSASTGAGQKGVHEYRIVQGDRTFETFHAWGLNNIGMLITTSGKVTYSATGYFYIDDGHSIMDDSGHTGIKVIGAVPQPDPLPPGWTPVGHYVAVTGISTCFKAASPSTDLFRQILATQVNLIQ